MAGSGGTEGFVPLGSRIGDISLPDDPCPPDLGGLGQKVEIFDGPPLPDPFDTKVPSCSLARGPGAVLLAGRGLVCSSSEQQMYHVERLMALQMQNLIFLIHLCVQRQAQARLFHTIERQNWFILS